MANVYVASTGSNTSPYDTWAKAATTLKTATDYASAGDVIYAHQESETITTDTTYTLQNGVKVIGSNDTANAPPQTLGTRTITSTTAAVDITISNPANGWSYFYGLALKAATGGSGANIKMGGASPCVQIYENCAFELQASSMTSQIEIVTTSVSAQETYVMTKNCTFTWGNASQGIAARGRWFSYGDDLVAGATVPTTLFKTVGTAFLRMEGADLSDVSGTIFSSPAGFLRAEIVNSKVHASVTVPPTWNSIGEGEISMFNCNSGDAHYSFAHYNYAGSTVISTSIYPTSTGASYDGTNRHTWVVASSANANFYSPYVTPWIPVYHDGTSAITPALEILRDGSATAYQDDEVWAEFSYQGTASSTRSTIESDRMALLGTAANQGTGALAAGDWTGEGGTAWFGKLEPASITPAEIGHLSARVCVGEPSITVYVDPQIRERT
jgi:hypothetical protein